LYFWGIYEMGFPEGSCMKAPEGFKVSLGAFFHSIKIGKEEKVKILVLLASIVVLGSILFCPMVIAAPPVPNEVQIVQPDPSLPKGLAAFWGKWEGSGFDSGQGRQIQFFLIIEKITEEKATLYIWHSIHGWSARREANVTKEGDKYKLWYTGPYGRNEITLKGEELVYDAQPSWFTLTLKRVP
jgi:hypothetical protein